MGYYSEVMIAVTKKDFKKVEDAQAKMTENLLDYVNKHDYKENNKDCVFTCYDEKGCCYCAIEKAYRAGKVDFYKPVSCHLYPIRVGNYGSYKAVNYHRWDVCKAAVLLGRKENQPVYKF